MFTCSEYSANRLLRNILWRAFLARMAGALVACFALFGCGTLQLVPLVAEGVGVEPPFRMELVGVDVATKDETPGDSETVSVTSRDADIMEQDLYDSINNQYIRIATCSCQAIGPYMVFWFCFRNASGKTILVRPSEMTLRFDADADPVAVANTAMEYPARVIWSTNAIAEWWGVVNPEVAQHVPSPSSEDCPHPKDWESLESREAHCRTCTMTPELEYELGPNEKGRIALETIVDDATYRSGEKPYCVQCTCVVHLADPERPMSLTYNAKLRCAPWNKRPRHVVF